MVSLEEFKKIDLRIARIKEVSDHPNADRLYVITIDLGEATKQIVAGIKASYAKEALIGRYVVVVNNLEPAVLRGVESQAMLLAARDDRGIAIIGPDREVAVGGLIS